MAETLNSFDTAQGRFDRVKYSNGPEHIYSVDEEGKKTHIDEGQMLQAFPYEGPQGPPPAITEASSAPTAEPILEAAPSSEPTRIEVRTEDEPVVPTEPAVEDRPASAETETGKENYRREAINPENILELKDKFDQAYSKELELHNIKTDEDKNKDPWMVESSAEQVRNKLLREYLKIGEKDWDQQELAEVRNDIIHMMSLSTKTLESLMLKPEENLGDTATAPRTVIEAEPTVITPEPIVVEPAQPVEVEDVLDEETQEIRPPKGRFGQYWEWLKGKPKEAKDAAVNARIAAMNRAAGIKEEPSEDENLTPEEKERKHKCRRVAFFVGGVLVGAAGVGLAWWLSSKGMSPFDNGPGGGEDLLGVDNGDHIETWNEGQGNRYVQSVLPNGLEQLPIDGVSGPEQIIDKNGNVLVDHVTFKDNGAYSDATLQKLHDAGYPTDVISNSINDTDGGPGLSGNVEGRWASVVGPKES